MLSLHVYGRVSLEPELEVTLLPACIEAVRPALLPKPQNPVEKGGSTQLRRLAMEYPAPPDTTPANWITTKAIRADRIIP